jgi:hypothetical protein
VPLAPGDAIVAPDGLDFFACILGADEGGTVLIRAALDSQAPTSRRPV